MGTDNNTGACSLETGDWSEEFVCLLRWGEGKGGGKWEEC